MVAERLEGELMEHQVHRNIESCQPGICDDVICVSVTCKNVRLGLIFRAAKSVLPFRHVIPDALQTFRRGQQPETHVDNCPLLTFASDDSKPVEQSRNIAHSVIIEYPNQANRCCRSNVMDEFADEQPVLSKFILVDRT